MFKTDKFVKWSKFLVVAIYLSIFSFITVSAEESLIGNVGISQGDVNPYIQTNEKTQSKNKSVKKFYGETEDINSQNNEEEFKEERKGIYVRRLEKSDIEKEYEDRILDKNIEINQFGYDFFQGEPVVNLNAPVSKNYVVGIGDKLIVYINNAEVASAFGGVLKLTVNRNGEIYIPDVGTFNVVGATLKDVEDLLSSAIGSPVSVSLAKLRSFTVYVSGEVYRPGAVRVSNLNTVLDVLMLAGGIRKTGSLRNIVLTRTNGQKMNIDLYKLLVFGKPINIRLRDGDVILVKPIGKTVAVIGKVKRPAIYEIKGGESIKEILDLAGGLLPSAYKYKVILQRYSEHKYMKIETGKLNDELFISKPVKSGDIIEIKSIYNEPLNFVEIKGEVKYPGRYEYKEGMKLSDLINYENIKMDTNLDYAEIERRDLLTFEIKEIIVFAPRDILTGQKDILLQRLDTIRIFPRYTHPPIKVSGFIKKPYIVPYRENIKLSEALFKAQFNDNPERLVVEIYRNSKFIEEEKEKKEYSKLFINRYKFSNEKEINLGNKNLYGYSYKDKYRNKLNYRKNINIYGNLDNKYNFNEYSKLYSKKTKEENKEKEEEIYKFYKKIYLYDLLIENDYSKNIKLKPGDRLVIRKLKKNEIVKKVYIGGYVKRPGVYDITKYPTLYDVLKATGGFKPNAYPKGLILLREKVAQIQYEKLELAVNLMKQELLKEEAGIMRADITSAEQKGLEVSYEARRKFLDTLKETQITGRLAGIKVPYNLEKLKNSPFNIKLENGDKIYIPPIPNDIYIFGEVFNPSTLIYMKGLTVEDYIKLAGGLTKYADEDNIFVIKADGTTISSQSSKSLIQWDKTHKRFVWGGYYNDILSYKLEPGDAIIVPTEIKVPTMWRPLLKDVLQIIYQSILSAYMVKRL